MKKTSAYRAIAAAIAATSVQPAAAENIVFPPGAGVVDITQPPFNAVGDGRTDCTEAIQKAVDQYRGRNRTLYFPNGVYLISDSVGIFGGKAHSRDRFLTWQGQSEAGTIIKLKDHASGFDNPDKPKIVVSIYEGESTGDVMHSCVRNLTIDVGAGNPGAVGLRFMTNNVGMVERVTIRSSDPAGAGAIGLDMRQSQNGPGLVQRVTVRGFDYGVRTGNSFSLVFEHLTLENQRVLAFDNRTARTTIRRLRSRNRIPVLRTREHGHLTLVEAELTGGDPAETAIINETRMVYLRDVRQEGYGHILRDADGNLHAESVLPEWFEGQGHSLFGAPLASLRLPIEETPEVPWEEDLNKWIVIDKTQDDALAAHIQEAIDAGAREGKTTLCFSPGEYRTIDRPIRVHGSINRIIGMTSIVNVRDPALRFLDDDAPAIFTFEDLRSDVLIVERFFLLGGWKCPPHVTMFENRSGKTIVLRNVGVGGTMKKADPGGRWFIEDVSPARKSTLRIGKGERVWARQYNPESPEGVMMAVNGGQLWILGLKTEGRTVHLDARNGARVEMLGGVVYQSWADQSYNPPLLRIRDSEVSATLGFYHHDQPFAVIVEETRDGATRILKRSDLKHYHLPLYRAGGPGEK